MCQRFRRPVEALQAQSQRVARSHVFRGNGNRTFEQLQRLLIPALLLEPGGGDVQQHRVFEAARQGLLGQLCGAHKIAVLR
jgi:hypothetical protein